MFCLSVPHTPRERTAPPSTNVPSASLWHGPRQSSLPPHAKHQGGATPTTLQNREEKEEGEGQTHVTRPKQCMDMTSGPAQQVMTNSLVVGILNAKETLRKYHICPLKRRGGCYISHNSYKLEAETFPEGHKFQEMQCGRVLFSEIVSVVVSVVVSAVKQKCFPVHRQL